MPYCPNCNAELETSDLVSKQCWNCAASFSEEAAWRPLAEPSGPFNARAQLDPAPKGTPNPKKRKLLPWAISLASFLFGTAFIYITMLQVATGEIGNRDCSGSRQGLCLLIKYLHELGGPLLAASPGVAFGLFWALLGILHWHVEGRRHIRSASNPSFKRTRLRRSA